MTDVQELRITLTVDDFDAAVRLYRDALELPQVADWSRWGERVSGKVRLALQVPDADLSAASLVAAGATPVAPAVATPWGDRNAGVAAPDGMQLTLFTPGEES